MNTGKVYLVGAGPGAADLMTVRAHRVLAQADVVLYDRLVNAEILDLAKPKALLVDVGKRFGQSSAARQNTIHSLLIQQVKAGRCVVRLKGGDPFVFGRGAEEVAALATEGIHAEVVPGISAAIAVPGSVGIPVTMRGVASSFGVFAGHPADSETDDGIDWEAAARIQTAVFLMGVGRLALIVEKLRAHGRSVDTPIALIENGTLADEKIVTGTLANILQRAGHISPPATIIVGEVVHQKKGDASPSMAPEAVLQKVPLVALSPMFTRCLGMDLS